MSPQPDGTLTWRELLVEATDRLRRAGLESAALDARRIVEEATGAEPSELPLVLDTLAGERAVAHFDSMLLRRTAGEPLQYVLGRWSFRTLDLMVDHRVLIPRPETESVVTVALQELDRLGGNARTTTVLDMGTGSGAIALSIAAERVRSHVWATDVDPDALDVARANVAGLGRAGARVTVVAGDWFQALDQDLSGRIDLIVSNPPYVDPAATLPPEVAQWEPTKALFSADRGTADLRVLVEGAPRWLADDGVLVCELSPEQAPAMIDAAVASFDEVRVVPDLAGRDRTLVARTPLR